MDIFERVIGERAVWVEAADDLQSSFLRLVELCMTKPGDYFAYDDEEARIVAEVSCYRHHTSCDKLEKPAGNRPDRLGNEFN